MHTGKRHLSTQTKPHLLKIFAGMLDLPDVFSPVISVAVNVVEAAPRPIGTVNDRRLRNRDFVCFRYDGPHGTGQIEAAVGEAFQKFVNAENGAALMPVAPGAALLDFLAGVDFGVILARDPDCAVFDNDEKRVAGKFCRVQTGILRPQSEVNRSAARLRSFHYGDRTPERFAQKLCELLRGKTG